MPKKIWMLYGVMWLFTASITLIAWMWATRIGLRVEQSSVVSGMKIILGAVAVSGLLLGVACIPRYKDITRKFFYLDVSHVLVWIALLGAFSQVGVVFQYLCVTTDFPLISNTLISVDSALGFHWLNIYQGVRAHWWIHSALGFAYESSTYQLVAIPFILALTRNTQDYVEFVVQFVVSAILVILISVPFPAESAFVYFGIHDPNTASTVSDFSLFRSGHARELVLSSAQGLVSFPSFHTILALSFAYSLRHVRYVFPIGITLNAAMVFSTPTQGGHYLCDVLSGLVVGALAIYFVRRYVFRSEISLPDDVPLTTATRNRERGEVSGSPPPPC